MHPVGPGHLLAGNRRPLGQQASALGALSGQGEPPCSIKEEAQLFLGNSRS